MHYNIKDMIKKIIQLSIFLFALLFASNAYASSWGSGIAGASSWGSGISSADEWTNINESNLQIYLPFGGDNASNSYDLSSNGLTGTVTDATWTAGAGHDGHGTYVYGAADNYITFAKGGVPQIGTGDFTLSVWVKTTSNNPYNGIFTLDNYRPGFYTFDANKIRILYNATNAISAVDASIADGTWRHLTFLRRGTGAGEVEFYLDGELLSTATLNTNITNPITDISVGWDRYSGDDFEGTIDDLRFYYRALDLWEIEYLANN